MIKPSIGRVVWFTESQAARKANNGQPFAAIVTYVHSDSLVNLAVFDANGGCIPKTSVFLHQPEDDTPQNYYCEWMPYQVGQAAKTEQLEKQLSGDK